MIHILFFPFLHLVPRQKLQISVYLVEKEILFLGEMQHIEGEPVHCKHGSIDGPENNIEYYSSNDDYQTIIRKGIFSKYS